MSSITSFRLPLDADATPAMSAGDATTDHFDSLAQVEAREAVMFNDAPCNIRTVVSVRECPLKFQSRLGYHATLYLSRQNEKEREIGFIRGWRISKPSGVNSSIDPRYFMKDWYFKDLRTYDESSRRLANCVRAIYGKGNIARRISDRVVDSQKRDELRDGGNEIVFIETIYIKWCDNLKDNQSEVRHY